MAVNFVSFFSFFLLISTQIETSKGHGRLMDPPSRNAQWRFGFPNPVNYNDNELFCGGRSIQWEKNGGKCGVCGDAWNLPRPRPHEDGGLYGKGIIVKRYTAGQNVDVEVELTANHMGTFKFKLCPYNGDSGKLTQQCFDQHPLSLVMPNGNLTDEFYISHKRAKIKSDTYYLTVRLPSRLTCSRCIFQWTYTAGNGWGICPDGHGALGCGPQETFVNCADVSINSNTGSGFGPPQSISSSAAAVSASASSLASQITSAENNISNHVLQEDRNVVKQNPYLMYYRDYSKKGTPIVPLIVRSQVCVGTGQFKDLPGMNRWCQANCLRYPPVCPQDKCKCLKDCDALPPFNKLRGSDQYCLDKCLVYPSKCPNEKCKCR